MRSQQHGLPTRARKHKVLKTRRIPGLAGRGSRVDTKLKGDVCGDPITGSARQTFNVYGQQMPKEFLHLEAPIELSLEQVLCVHPYDFI